MAGKMVNGASNRKTPATTEALRKAVDQRYTGVMFEVPGYDIVVEVAMLKRREREEIVRRCEQPGNQWDNLLSNRMAVAYGLISPKLLPDMEDFDANDNKVHEAYVEACIEELSEYPDSLIDPIANEIWRLSNDYRGQSGMTGKGGAESRPFLKTSGLASGSSIEPVSTPT